MAYATPEDMIARKSVTTLGQLCSDSGTSVAAIDLETDPYLQAALDSASGAIDAALMQAGRYTVADLAGLTGNSLAYLVHLTCEIAMAYLFARKPTYAVTEYEASLKLQSVYLDQLRRGENVFNLPAQIDAGTPKFDQPSVASIERLGLLRDRTLNYYPVRHSTNG